MIIGEQKTKNNFNNQTLLKDECHNHLEIKKSDDPFGSIKHPSSMMQHNEVHTGGNSTLANTIKKEYKQPSITTHGIFPISNEMINSQYQSYEFDQHQNKFMEKTNYTARVSTHKILDRPNPSNLRIDHSHLSNQSISPRPKNITITQNLNSLNNNLKTQSDRVTLNKSVNIAKSKKLGDKNEIDY